MRIIGNIPHPTLKITLMHHGRHLLKLEDRDTEVTYKFRDGEGVHDLASAQRCLDLGLLQEAERTLRELSSQRARFLPPAVRRGDSLPNII